MKDTACKVGDVTYLFFTSPEGYQMVKVIVGPAESVMDLGVFCQGMINVEEVAAERS